MAQNLRPVHDSQHATTCLPAEIVRVNTLALDVSRANMHDATKLVNGRQTAAFGKVQTMVHMEHQQIQLEMSSQMHRPLSI